MSAILDQLTKYERDLFREDQKVPAVSNPDFKLYLAELWDWEGYERAQGRADNIEYVIAGWSCKHPGWTRDQIIAGLAFQNVNGALNADLGWSRRLMFDDPSEFARGLLFGARWEWLRRRQQEQEGGGMEGDDAFVATLALPLMDMPLIERVRDAPISDPDASRQMLYECVMAVLRQDSNALERTLERFNKRKVHLAYQGMRTVLTGISQANADLVAQGLGEIIADESSLRKRKESRGYSAEAHQFYGLARWLSPDLVRGFDVTQSLPWDAALHAYLAAGGNPLEGVDFRDISPVLHDAFIELKPPPWWRILEERELPQDPCRLTLTDLGPTPVQVRDLLPQWLQVRRWPIVSLDTFPAVIAAEVPRAQATQFAQGLRQFSASAQVERVK